MVEGEEKRTTAVAKKQVKQFILHISIFCLFGTLWRIAGAGACGGGGAQPGHRGRVGHGLLVHCCSIFL